MASAKELEWLDLYLETGNDKEATRKVFNCSTERNVTVRSSQLKKHLAADIDKRLRETMRINAVALHKILCNLATTATSEQVRAKAAMDLLDRGGYKPVDKQEIMEVMPDREAMQEQWDSAVQEIERQAVERYIQDNAPKLDS